MRNKFIHWYNEVFKQTKMYTEMRALAEESPWHREHSIAVHTDMVVMEYITRWDDHEANIYGIHGAFAAAFHDVGKPDSCVFKFKEERGDYKAFHGHEQLSARMWENYAVLHMDELNEQFGFGIYDIYRIGFMIEYHKPWDIKNPEKLRDMALTLMVLGVDREFVDLVKADTWGRLSDDQEEKRAKVNAWCEEFENRCMSLSGHSIFYNLGNPDNKPVMYVPIGASGTGKSTYLNTLREVGEDLNVFSLDLMRHELYGDDYAYAFQQSTKDKHFRSQCNERYRELLRENKSLYLDNTSTSKKNRRFYITEARNRGYHIVGVLLPVGLRTVLDRQLSREDKTVPEDAVRRQYNGMQLPQFGEFDNVLVEDSNF